ncbi:putative molybdopterin synthase subunit MoaD [Moraxella macacae 0408225]|uniref:Molybdopterin synthase sulfur carrier subunit n=1 Tax=Moraxella macacae 0408225 TaxID=1230338 RepID=L2F8F9_9GAMM|nr:molybdopterin converting factor subunit 1 [Moraxella macacae]ELA09359.1 putative molybdopterin synthase subunit MoaD [Moraxella macacae 0408225]
MPNICNDSHKIHDKKINVLYFASLADHAGIDEEQLMVNDETAGQIFDKLSQKYNFSLSKDKIAVAINHEFSNWQTPINHGDILAFIPPVAGG